MQICLHGHKSNVVWLPAQIFGCASCEPPAAADTQAEGLHFCLRLEGASQVEPGLGEVQAAGLKVR